MLDITTVKGKTSQHPAASSVRAVPGAKGPQAPQFLALVDKRAIARFLSDSRLHTRSLSAREGDSLDPKERCSLGNEDGLSESSQKLPLCTHVKNHRCGSRRDLSGHRCGLSVRLPRDLSRGVGSTWPHPCSPIPGYRS